MRADGRTPLQLRPITIETGFQKHAEGSVRIKFGDTHVSCAASVERGVPGFLVGKGTGWVTAEYAMLPRSTHTRSKRDPGGRGKEIQRLIGRALRQAIDLSKLGEYTIHIDCDVLQADGGTRVASITGAWVALALALETMQKRGWIADLSALSPPVAAVSVGIIDGEVRVDLPYEEDSRATVDMNVVMDHNGQLIEVQGTGEHGTFSRVQMNELLDAASVGINDLIKHQLAAVPFWRAK